MSAPQREEVLTEMAPKEGYSMDHVTHRDPDAETSGASWAEPPLRPPPGTASTVSPTSAHGLTPGLTWGDRAGRSEASGGHETTVQRPQRGFPMAGKGQAREEGDIPICPCVHGPATRGWEL
jgi:hypothetical protein